jgi:uncharacterized protein
MPLRAVYDTNVWISGTMWQGAPFRCLQAVRQGHVELYYCREMGAEFTDKLRTKFGFTENAIHQAIYEYRRLSRLVEIEGVLRVVPDDPHDDKFLECAVVADVHYIVSSDRHLLDLIEYQEIPIFTPKQFLWRLETRS